MAINLSVKAQIGVSEAVTDGQQELARVREVLRQQELAAEEEFERQKALKEKQAAEKKKSEQKQHSIDSKDICFAAEFQTNQTVAYKERSKRYAMKKKKQDEESCEKNLQGVKVRKYTKEMQNRDAIRKVGKAMKKRAQQTKSDFDDKFADKTLAPSKNFDKIVYNAPTADDAVKKLDNAFEDAVMTASRRSLY